MNRRNYEVLSQIIVARCLVEDELICNVELHGLLLDKNNILTGVEYCEIKNLAISTMLFMNDVRISIEFDLVFAYEYSTFGGNGKHYGIRTEKVQKALHIEKSRFSNAFGCAEYLQCKCLMKDMRYITEIDFTMTVLTISAICDIDCIILKEEIIELFGVISDSVKQNKPDRCSSDFM